MTILGYKRVTVILSIVCVALVAASVSLFVGYAPLKLRLMMASEQVHIFEEMRSRALQGSPSSRCRCGAERVARCLAGLRERGARSITDEHRMVDKAVGEDLLIAQLRYHY